MALYVDSAKLDSESRIVMIKLSACTLRLMETYRRCVGNYDDTMIILAVLVISSERLTRINLEPELRDLATQVPSERLARTNVSSIAAATGLNRETVRRRVRRLIGDGLILRLQDGGLRVTSEAAKKLHVRYLVMEQLENLRRTANQLLRDEVLTWRPS